MTETVECAGQLALGEEAREQGFARVEAAADDGQRSVIDQALAHVAARGQTFSANDVRPLLPPGIRPALVGARFMAASRRGEIRKVGWIPSTDPGDARTPGRAVDRGCCQGSSVTVGVSPYLTGTFGGQWDSAAKAEPRRRFLGRQRSRGPLTTCEEVAR